MFLNLRQYKECFDDGRCFISHFRKVPSQASLAYGWTDLSMAAGNPLPNYYASTPLIADTLISFRGLFHGDNKSPAEKYLTEMMIVTPTANFLGKFMLLDYLLYYPFIDMDSSDEQILDNTITTPRYADGDGVMAMLVAVAPTTGGGIFTFNYVNQNGEEKTSVNQRCSTSVANISNIVTSGAASVAGYGPFLILNQGDTGIRRINSITFSTLNGGLAALALVKPLGDIKAMEINAPYEMTFIERRPGLPRIYDGAYLGMICCAVGSIAAGLLTGRMNFIWTN